MSGIVEELEGCDATVCFAVDATQIAKSLKVRRPEAPFNFGNNMALSTGSSNSSCART